MATTIHKGSYYTKLIEMYSYIFSGARLVKGLGSLVQPMRLGYNLFKTLGNRQMIRRFRDILNLLANDRQFRAFHERQTDVLPEFYHQQYELVLGPYASLMSREDRKPVLVSSGKYGIVALPEQVTFASE
jgi:hypothetical protein